MLFDSMTRRFLFVAAAVALLIPVQAHASPTVSLTAVPNSVAYGSSTVLNWTSTNASLCAIPWGSSATSGSYTTPSLFSNTTYTITCYGPTGSQSASSTVTVSGPPPAPSVSLVASPATVPRNATTTLSWASTNATSCNTPWGSTATSGTYTTPPITYEQTFTVTCSGYGGSNAAYTTVRIGQATAPVPAPTVSLQANPASIAYNTSTTLSWLSSQATACTTPWGSTAVSGSYTTPLLLATTSYLVSCIGPGGVASATSVVVVAPAPPPPPPPAPTPTVSLTANPASVPSGTASTLTWASTNATSCSTPWGATATSGSYQTPALTANTSYTVTCTGAGGSKSASVTVQVTTAPPPPPPPPPTGFTVTLSADPTSVAYGSTSRLTWTSNQADYCAIPWGSSATSGSYVTPPLFNSTSYTITCYGAAGSRQASITLTVSGPPPAPTVTVTAQPATVAMNSASTLTWASTNATSCNTPWGSSATGGIHVTPPISYTQTFTVTCSGYGGSNAANVTVAIGAVSPPPAPTVSLVANPASIVAGASSNLAWTSTNASVCSTPWGSTATSGNQVVSPSNTTSYTVTCTGPGGSRSASASVLVLPAPVVPVVTLTASPASVAYNASTVLAWSSTNATSCVTPWGSTATSGTFATAALSSTSTYQVTCTGAGGSHAAVVTVVVAPAPTAGDLPIVFNASASARPGDVVSLQGHNFGAAATAYLESAPAQSLEVVNRVGTTWLAVQVPDTATGALILRVRNAVGVSAPVRLNAALPMHLDAIEIVSGGAMRIFGRNLLLPGSTPSVTINGSVATVQLAQSDEHMLVLTAPANLTPGGMATILVDNGNGSGPTQLDRSIAVVAAGTGDPFTLGVGWATAFAELATRTINAATDARLTHKVQCNANTDDSPAVQEAIQLAASLGGGVVKLPAGQCRLSSSVNLRSKVVVEGAGKALTELRYAANYPVFGVGLDLLGLRNLTLTNVGTALEGPLLKQSTRVVVQNVRVNLGRSNQMYLDGNRNIVVTGSDFFQTSGISDQGPYTFYDSAGLVFSGNTTKWVVGAPAFGRIHDSYVKGNRFTRDGSVQATGGVVHSMTIDFAYRTAVIENTLDVAGGPITNAARNDGETILTEGGGAARTENLGTVTSAGTQTLTDTGNTLVTDPFGNGYVPENYGVAIVAGKGAGQTRRVVSYSRPTLAVDKPWDVVPDNTSRYATFVWGLEKSLIKNNILSQNPRGIWLYQTAIRDVDVIGNQISEGGGIYLRSFQNLTTKQFTPIYNVLIAKNNIINTTGLWMSYINAVFVNSDARAFGIATIGIEMRSNRLTANQPNRESQTEEYANIEGFMNMMRVENYSLYESSIVPRLLGTVLSTNTCTNCNVAVRIGTGAGGTTVLNTQLINSPVLITDTATTVTNERSTDTVVR